MKSRTVALVCFLFTGLATRNAQAFCRATTSDPNLELVAIGADGCPTGPPLYWKSECIGIHPDAAASTHLALEETQALLAAAFGAWESAGGACAPSINVLVLSPTSKPTLGYKKGSSTNENDVIIRDDGWPYASPASQLELVSTTFEKSTGELLDADIEFNGAMFPGLELAADGGTIDPKQSNDLRALFMHAAGHFLGFGHSADPTSIMSPILAPGDTRPAVLSDDDVAGMCAAYPPNGERPVIDSAGRMTTVAATSCVLGSAVPSGSCSSTSPLHIDHGCSVGASTSSSRSSASLLAAGALAFVSAFGRRRRS